MSCSPYMPIPARLEAVVKETSNISTFTVRPEHPLSFEAGQFVELTVPGVGEAPFTPSSSPVVTDTVDITIMNVGRVTQQLHSMSPGSDIAIRGPLGQPYPLDDFRKKEILIVGGGVGLAPLRALLFALFEDIGAYERILLRYGARKPEDIVYREAVTNAWGKGDHIDVMLTVDESSDGWKGNTGVVTKILEPEKLDVNVLRGVAVVCGPPIMMKFTTFKLLELGYAPENIYLSMEKNMSCGVGKCGHCRLGPYYACKDGPVFKYSQVRDVSRVWD